MSAKKPTEKASPKSTEAKAKRPAAAKKAPKAKVKAAPQDAATASARSTKACSISGCKREYRAKGYCTSHYREWRNGKFGHSRYKTCVDQLGCLRPMANGRHGYCEEHFVQYYIKGEAVAHAPKPEAAPAPEKKEAAAS